MLRAPAFAAIVLIAANASAQPPAVSLKDVTVLGSSGGWPFAWGVIATWVRFEVGNSRVRTDVYAAAMTPEQPIPRVGSVCSITARPEVLFPGHTADGRPIPNEPVLYATSVECGGKEYIGRG
jgi:hypothetical protein